MIIQFTDQQYSDLAVASGIPPEQADAAGHHLRRIHRLLAIDGKQLDQLLPDEQQAAMAFVGLTLASTPEIQNGKYTGVKLEAFEVESLAERPQADTPRAEVGRRVRAELIEQHPEAAHHFYWQLEQANPPVWHRHKMAVMRELKMSDADFTEMAAARWSRGQHEKRWSELKDYEQREQIEIATEMWFTGRLA